MFGSGTISTRDLLFSDHKPNLLHKILSPRPRANKPNIRSFRLTGSLVKPSPFGLMRMSTASPRASPDLGFLPRNFMSANLRNGTRSRSALGLGNKRSRGGNKELFTFKTVDGLKANKYAKVVSSIGNLMGGIKRAETGNLLLARVLRKSNQTRLWRTKEHLHNEKRLDELIQIAVNEKVTVKKIDPRPTRGLGIFENAGIRVHLKRKVECGTEVDLESDTEKTLERQEATLQHKSNGKVSIQISSDPKEFSVRAKSKASPRTPQRAQHNFVFKKSHLFSKEGYSQLKRRAGRYSIAALCSPRYPKNNLY